MVDLNLSQHCYIKSVVEIVISIEITPGDNPLVDVTLHRVSLSDVTLLAELDFQIFRHLSLAFTNCFSLTCFIMVDVSKLINCQSRNILILKDRN